jgi:hypothetical protein
VVHPAGPTDLRPRQPSRNGRTGRRPALPAGPPCPPPARRRCAYPWTSQHTSVVTLQVLQAMLAEDIAPAGRPQGRHNPDRTAVRHDSEAGRMTVGGRRVRIHGPRSALGPYRIGHLVIPEGTSGHDEYNETTGHRTFTPRTSVAGARPKRVRIPPDGCRGPAALANEARVALDRPHPSPELVPSPPGRSRGCSHRPCHLRAIPSTTPPVHHGQPRTLLTA